MRFEESRYSDEIEAAKDAARKAGKILDRYRRKGAELDGRKKSHNDIVTEADIEAQQKIVEVLQDRFPGDAVKAEENELDEGNSDRVWVVDPIDGTTNFFRGLDYFCTSIGLRIGNKSVLGVIYSPETGLGEAYVGLKDHGAYRLEGIEADHGERITVSRQDMKGGVYSAYLRDGETGKLKRQAAIIEELSSREMVHRASGAAALDLCMIAGGTMEMLVDYLSEWDYAAGKAVVEEAGGEVEVVDSRLDQDLVIGSNSRFHDEVSEIARDVMERF